MEDGSPPVACSLNQTNLAERTERWQALTARALRQTTHTSDGVRLVFAAGPGVADELESLAAHERDCCAFAAWSVRADADAATLDVTGDSEAAVTAVRSLFPALGTFKENAAP
jgi:hypothetical protein